MKLALQPFTLVGATTCAGMLTNPLRDRFGVVTRLEFYNIDELTKIVTHSAALLGAPIGQGGACEVAAHAARRVPPTACCVACATMRKCRAMAALPRTSPSSR